MTWREASDRMRRALRERFVPALRSRGFRGSMPHFRRVRSEGIDVLSVQFSQWGGAFIVEIARSGPDGARISSGRLVPPDKVAAHHLRERHRLGAPAPRQDGRWFRFDGDTPPTALADEAAGMLSEAEAWWAAFVDEAAEER